MQTQTLTLAQVAQRPQTVTYSVVTRSAGHLILRPLEAQDVDALAAFLMGLSPETRYFSTFASYDLAMAQAMCDAINRYDKLRFVVESSANSTIIGLMEFSLDIPKGDLRRYAEYGVPLDARYDCRFGPTLADEVQSVGIGSALFPALVDVARRFGKQRMILWGGVLADNSRALRFYEKQGFRRVGAFTEADGLRVVDMILVVNRD